MPLVSGHQLTYNATKSFTLCFKQKHIKTDLPDFVLGKLVIPAVDKCKHCDADLHYETNNYIIKQILQ